MGKREAYKASPQPTFILYLIPPTYLKGESDVQTRYLLYPRTLL
jgi:hypothetical protein